MKIKLLLSILCITAALNAQIINIPDANFKAKLLQTTNTNNIAFGSSGVGSIQIDINNDGEIQVSEALRVYELSVSSSNIINLTGIEYFTNLTKLGIAANNLTTVNLSALTQLIHLGTHYNPLTSLNLSGLINLQWLICHHNQLTHLNFAGLPNLQRVYCGDNLLTSLDFTDNPMFFDLGCRNNPNLTSIKIKNATTQLYGAATAYNECWGCCPNLNYICADANEIPALQSFLSGCGITQPITIDSACALGKDDFSLQNVGVYPNPATKSFNINTTVSKVMIYNLAGQLVKVFNNNFDSHYSYNIQELDSGVYLVKISIDGKRKTIKLVKE